VSIGGICKPAMDSNLYLPSALPFLGDRSRRKARRFSSLPFHKPPFPPVKKILL